ncbi:hypothetical protein [uncultured Hymenobacter sp.]|uniref:hypothetical protein n=1 Tax=uncultured Hymenobacter sp. TaxID=170016 RepID=UPI0035CBCA34
MAVKLNGGSGTLASVIHSSYTIPYPDPKSTSVPKEKIPTEGEGELPLDFIYMDDAKNVVWPRQKQMYEGSGGDYLSNEIFYRVARIRQENRPTLPTGHFHTPVILSDKQDLDLNKDVETGSKYDFEMMRRVIANTRIILTQGVTP